jgi:superfamily II DNA or RNA helicase
MPAADVLRPGDAVRIRAERWRVTRYIPFTRAALIEVAGAGHGNRGTRTTFLLPFEPCERLARSDAPQVVRPAAWRAIARRTLAAATPGPHALRTAAQADFALAPFQLEPALALLAGRGCRALIADDVGLGKTVQAALVIAEVLAREPGARVLVICPAGLREQWQGELRDRFAIDAAMLDAAGAARIAAAQGALVNPWAAQRLVIASIDYVKRPEVMRAVEPLMWDVLVLDESHGLGGGSDRASAANALAQRARRVLMLTATPHSGDDEAFDRMCGIGRLDGDAPLMIFRRSRDAAGIHGERRGATLRVSPTPAEAAMHAALASYARLVQPGAQLAMSVLLRRACSSATSLAQSLERRLALLGGTAAGGAQMTLPFVEPALSDEEPAALLAVPGLEDAREEQRILRRLLAIAERATARESKVAALRRLLRRTKQPAIVFTEYRDTLAHLAAQLAGAACLHGGMTATQRRAATSAFTGGTVNLLLATDAASEGLNLHQRCRLVINLELPWTPLRLEQRVGRVDRIGQRQTVHAIHLVARGSSEEAIAARLSDRGARAATALDQVRTVDMRSDAEAEASRLRVARAMLALPAEAGRHKNPVPAGAGRYKSRSESLVASAFRRKEQPYGRPALCTLRSRRRAAPGRYWVWTLVFVDDADRLIWESLLSLRAAPVPRVDDESIACTARQAEQQQLARVADETRTSLAHLARRELAIGQLLRHRHARLAASLLQPGLFDRRAERAAAAQNALVNEALARSSTRLAEIDAAGRPRVAERRLVFAVTLG